MKLVQHKKDESEEDIKILDQFNNKYLDVMSKRHSIQRMLDRKDL